MDNDAVYAMPESYGHYQYASAPYKQNRGVRKQRPHPLIKPSEGEVIFRIVCHVSVVGGVIGNSGAIVANLRRETGSKIHCEEPVPGSEHRVIFVVGSGSIDRRIILCYEEREERMVSSAQEAMIRVFERIWEVDAQNEGGNWEEAYCGLIADTTQIGAVVGKGGKSIVRMRMDSGAKIRILPPPYFASKQDELIQITGDMLAVKKALVAVSCCLQDCPPVEKDIPFIRRPVERPVERARNGQTHDPHAEFFPHLSLLLPPLSDSSAKNASAAHSSSTDGDNPSTQQEVLFRLLCTNVAAGSVIGRKGAIVRTLQNVTGASIIFAAPITESGERVVTISAWENLESWYSSAQNALVLVFARSVEADIERGLPSGLTKGTSVNARLLVASDQADCLNANGGRIISKMVEVTGANIQMLCGERVQDCASASYVVVQITGEYINVQNALFQVTGRLRDNLLPSEVCNEGRIRNSYERVKQPIPPGLPQPLSLSSGSDQEILLTRGINELSFPTKTGASPSPRMQQSQDGGRGETTAVMNYQRSSTTSGGHADPERSLDYLLPREVLNEVGARSSNRGRMEITSSGLEQSLGLSTSADQTTSLTRQIDQGGLPESKGRPSTGPPLPQAVGTRHAAVITDSERSLTPSGSSLELESGKQPAVVRNTTIEVVVAAHLFGFVYGQAGGNLARLRQISGAKVEVHDPCQGEREGTVVISGKPDQVRIAQSLLQAFILTGQ